MCRYHYGEDERADAGTISFLLLLLLLLLFLLLLIFLLLLLLLLFILLSFSFLPPLSLPLHSSRTDASLRERGGCAGARRPDLNRRQGRDVTETRTAYRP